MPYTTENEDKEFGAFFLSDTVDYIADNFDPEAVFGEDVLKEWIVGSYEPDDLFDAERLKTWALDNGYVEEE